MDDNVDIRYRNFYKCPNCGQEWEDDWDSMCNDRCPNCNAEIEPYKSLELGEDGFPI